MKHLEEAELHKNDSKMETDNELAQILNGHSIACSLIAIAEQLEKMNSRNAREIAYTNILPIDEQEDK